MTYRDDLDAAIARAEGLDQDLEAERVENERLRAELAKAKEPPPPEPAPPPPVIAKPAAAPPREPELPAAVDVRMVRAACSPFGFALFYTFNLVTFLLGFLATIPITLAIGEKRGIQPYMLAALPIILISLFIAATITGSRGAKREGLWLDSLPFRVVGFVAMFERYYRDSPHAIAVKLVWSSKATRPANTKELAAVIGQEAGSVDELSSTTAALKLAITNTTFRDAEWAGRRALLRGLHEVIEGPLAAIHARWPIAQIEVESRR